MRLADQLRLVMLHGDELTQREVNALCAVALAGACPSCGVRDSRGSQNDVDDYGRKTLLACKNEYHDHRDALEEAMSE